LDYLKTHTSLSPIWRGFSPGFVNKKKGCTRLTATSDKDYQLLAHSRRKENNTTGCQHDKFMIFYFWCFNATFSNISAISWQPVLVVEEAGVPRENLIL
jgi:hypothetical protein